MPLTEPRILNNRYRLDDHLGTGGMATVYRAHDLMLERTVAIKLLRMDLSADAEFRERFRQEARAAANLSHPNLVTVHDFGLDADQLFIVMENVPGTDLKTLLQKQGRFSIEDTLALMSQACSGLGYAHRAGLVHCDVKPQNMLVTPDKRLKVVDFGIARALASISQDESVEVVWGSPHYFSPEQAGGGAPSPASDVYSMGVVMFEMLTGQPPFTASTAEELARQHLEVPPPMLRSLNSAIPPEWDRIVRKALAKQPEARYSTADQLGRELAIYSQQQPAKSAGSPLIYRDMPAQQVQALDYRPYQQELEPGGQMAVPAPQIQSSADVDWKTWLLALLALIAVGGLVPFSIWVYSVLFPPLP